MNRYKPEFLGKMIQPDDPDQISDFVSNKYESFSDIYDVCKDDLDNISDVDVVDYVDGSSSLSVELSTDHQTIDNIKGKNKNENIKFEGNIIRY